MLSESVSGSLSMEHNSIVSPANVIFSVKTFLAAILAYGIAVYFDLSRPYWAMTSVYIVANPFSGAVASKAVYRILGTLLGGFAIILFIPNFVNSPVFLTMVIAVWVGGCLYFSLLDRSPRSYVFMLGGYTVLLTGFPLVDTPAQVFDVTVARVEEIVIAIICCAVINRIVLPRNNGPLLLGRIDSWRSDMTKLAGDILRGSHDSGKTTHEWQVLASETIEIRNLITLVSYDGSHYQELVGLMRGLQHRMVMMLPMLSAIKDHLAELKKYSNPKFNTIEAFLEQMASWIGREDNPGRDEVKELKDDLVKLEKRNLLNGRRENLLVVNIARRLQDLASIWSDCSLLRSDINAGKISADSKRIIKEIEEIPIHKDHRMAFLAAFIVVLVIGISVTFWILSGCSEGMGIAQLAGVACCLTAQADNPAPVMRKFLEATTLAVIAGFFYAFTIFPLFSSFFPLAASLGLSMIPMGIFAAVPSCALIGGGYCVNLPMMLMLQSKFNLDFATFANNSISVILAFLLAIAVSSIVKSIGAEGSARHLMRSGWRLLARIASHPRANNAHNLLELFDILGNLASRVAVVPSGAEILSEDLLRDLRIGRNIVELQGIYRDTPHEIRVSLAMFLKRLANIYRKKHRIKKQEMEDLIRSLDECQIATNSDLDKARSCNVQVILVALQICLNLPATSFSSELKEEVIKIGVM